MTGRRADELPFSSRGRGVLRPAPQATRGEIVPTYQYTCTDCGEQVEVVQKFTDDALTVCPACGGKLRKVFSPVGIVFKGSGFYRTDSRASQKSSEPAAASANGSSDSKDSKKADSATS